MLSISPASSEHPSKLQCPKITLMVPLPTAQARRSASVQHGILLRHVGPVIYHAIVDLDPGMGPEGHRLGADHQLRPDSSAPEQAGEGGRSMEAGCFFPKPDTCQVHRVT